MNLRSVQNFIEKSFLGFASKDGTEQTYSFDHFFDIFKLKETEDPVIGTANSSDYTRYENARTRDCPLFCRSCPWSIQYEEEHADVGRDFEDVIILDKSNPEYRRSI